MSIASGALQFTPLNDSEIRLVRFEKRPAQTDAIKLCLERHDIQSAPPYLALSYVWGDPTTTVPVEIDSHKFNVTENLFNALKQISELSDVFEEGVGRSRTQGRAELFLWIDAICINQQNTDEKSKQVPRMTQIYSMAYTVLVWFGTFKDFEQWDIHPDPDPDLELYGGKQMGLKLLVNQLERKSPLTDFAIPKWEPSISLGKADLGNVAYQMTRAYSTLLLSRWFERIWVVQEYTLSQRDPCALLGRAMFSFRSLYASVPDFRSLCEVEYLPIKNRVDRFARNLDPILASSFGQAYMQSEITSSAFRSKPFADQLLWLLLHVKGESSIPHDRLYGILGMLDLTKLPETLVPDYRQSYDLVCEEYTRFLIGSTGDLRILSIGDERTRDESTPSWVMDPRFLKAMLVEPNVRHTGFFSDDGRALSVEGVNCGQIEVSCSIDIPPFDDTDFDETAQAMGLAINLLQSFHKEIIRKAAVIRDEYPSVVWKQWFSDFLEEHCGYPRELGEKYDSPQEFIDDRMTPGPSGIVRTSYGDLSALEVLTKFLGRQFALMEDGRILHCVMRRLQAPASPCYLYALKGTVVCSIVRKTLTDQYEFVGHLTGTWNGRLKLDEPFFSEHKVDMITLV
jgi:Heterokaryon incompatibility protein (HET)